MGSVLEMEAQPWVKRPEEQGGFLVCSVVIQSPQLLVYILKGLVSCCGSKGLNKISSHLGLEGISRMKSRMRALGVGEDVKGASCVWLGGGLMWYRPKCPGKLRAVAGMGRELGESV